MQTLDWLDRAQAFLAKSSARCLFGQIALQKNGVGMAGQLDTLLN